MKKLLFLCITLINSVMFATNYFVALNGNNNNPGTQSLPWRNISYAGTKILQPGDTVFFKSGNYGNEQVTIVSNGTKSNPIVFKGYKNNYREFIFPLVNFDNTYSNFNYDVNLMPTLIGSNRNTGTAFTLNNRVGITLMNFQVENYSVGYSAGMNNNITTNTYISFINCNANKIGDQYANYSGFGFKLGFFQNNSFSKNSSILNCLVINACAEGIAVSGDSNKVENCMVVCNDFTTNQASTDYYISMCALNSTVQYCKIRRETGLYHLGYGIGFRSTMATNEGFAPAIIGYDSKNNKVLYCTTVNIGDSFYVKHRSENNYFYKCSAYGNYTGNSRDPVEDIHCIVIKDRSLNNKFEIIDGTMCNSAILFSESPENPVTGDTCKGNMVVNSLFSDGFGCFKSKSVTGISSIGLNYISANTFVRCKNNFIVEKLSPKIQFTSNIFTGTGVIGTFITGEFTLNASQFTYCDFYNISGVPSSYKTGTNISADPLFLSSNDRHLQTNSPCKNTGKLLNYVVRDADWQIRYNPTSIGAFR